MIDVKKLGLPGEFEIIELTQDSEIREQAKENLLYVVNPGVNVSYSIEGPSRTCFYLKENSMLKRVSSCSGGEEFLRVYLAGEGSKAELFSSFSLNNKKFSCDVLVSHWNRDTESIVRLRGALDNSSQAFLKGDVNAVSAATGNAVLDERVLFLDEGSEAVVLPQLEVEGTGVLSSHHASSEKMKESDLFYLMSRGLGRKEAEKLFIEGFLRV